jgi:3-oxoacyl-[acyl-carrier protein] reductase
MNVLVIGAGKGIGLEAVILLTNHLNLHITAFSRSTAELKKLKSSRSNLTIIQGDISKDEDIKELVDFLKKSQTQPDRILITAGVLIKKDFESLNRQDFRTCFEINVLGVFEVIRELSRETNDQKFRHIVTIGSMGGVQGSVKFPGMVFYSASKAALACLTECMAEELKDKNIHLNCLALGAVETDMKREAFPDYKAPHSAAEMGEWIVNFLMNGGSYFNGKVLPVSVSVP